MFTAALWGVTITLPKLQMRKQRHRRVKRFLRDTLPAHGKAGFNCRHSYSRDPALTWGPSCLHDPHTTWLQKMKRTPQGTNRRCPQCCPPDSPDEASRESCEKYRVQNPNLLRREPFHSVYYVPSTERTALHTLPRFILTQTPHTCYSLYSSPCRLKEPEALERLGNASKVTQPMGSRISTPWSSKPWPLTSGHAVQGQGSGRKCHWLAAPKHVPSLPVNEAGSGGT